MLLAKDLVILIHTSYIHVNHRILPTNQMLPPSQLPYLCLVVNLQEVILSSHFHEAISVLPTVIGLVRKPENSGVNRD